MKDFGQDGPRENRF